MKRILSLCLACLAVAAPSEARTKLRVGYFPNITHAQGVMGAHSSKEGKGWFEQRLGSDIEIEWLPFNAGPSAMESLLAGTIDLTYVGPNPALNAYIRSRGKEIRVLAGAAEGGAALVVRPDRIKGDGDFKGKRIATPQLGNTQDVAARAYFKAQGMRITPTGGDVLIVPTANPEQLTLFQSGRIDGAWTVEPWVSRLELEAGGKLYQEQKDTVTTLLVASVKLLKDNPRLADRFRAAHAELTQWIAANPEAAKEKVRVALGVEMRREMKRELFDAAWPRIVFTSDIRQEQLVGLVKDAQEVGYLRNAFPLDGMFSGKP
jgi:NitT/TauT family transport system substrate-binding protein